MGYVEFHRCNVVPFGICLIQFSIIHPYVLYGVLVNMTLYTFIYVLVLDLLAGNLLVCVGKFGVVINLEW